eukprot:GEMP01047827.1.p1 GENE.GEMP01047827.1~~GEMP01047827.1.p1  ORF type:complete len:207 (+),score=58.89 GEMP01047827.1:411-1031(+)
MDPEAIREKRKVLLEQWCSQHGARGPPPPAAPAPPSAPDSTGGAAKVDAKKEDTTVAIPVELECIVQDIATTGSIPYPWEHIRLLLAAKLDQCCIASWKEDAEKCCDTLEEFEAAVLKPLRESVTDVHRNGPPFTAQRMCELLVDRTKTYKSTRKYCAAIEKVLLVSSVDPCMTEQSRKRKAPDIPEEGSQEPPEVKRELGAKKEE